VSDIDEMAELLGRAHADTGDSIVIDLTQASDEFEPLPEGPYNAVVVAAERAQSKSGNPTIKFRFRITDGAFHGRQVFRYAPITGKGAGIARDTLKGLGFPVEGDRLAVSLADAIGRECVLDIAIQKNDPRYNEVKKVRRPA
jgi:hypothetical protein